MRTPGKLLKDLRAWDTDWAGLSMTDIRSQVTEDEQECAQALQTAMTTEEWKDNPAVFEMIVMGIQGQVDFESWQVAHPAFIGVVLELLKPDISDKVKAYITGCCQYHGFGGFGPIDMLPPEDGERQKEKVEEAMAFVKASVEE